jgi:sirohydrochlorin ferrochelatase
VINQLRAAVAEARPELDVVEAYVDEDVQQPGLRTVLAGSGAAVVVPALLSSGYHVYVDVAGAVVAATPHAVAAPALGPDPVLADVLAERLADAGGTDHAVVLAAAGASDARAAADVGQTAAMLGERLGANVTAAYATAMQPRISDAVAALRADGNAVAVASYVLAPGYFHDRIRESATDVVTAPLLPHPAIVDLVVRRYDDALMAE